MADMFSPPAPSPIAADDLADARLAPWPFSPWPAPHRDDGGGRANPLFTILPVSALGIGLVLLVAVAVILVLTRRAKPRTADAGGSCNSDYKPGAAASSCGSHNTRCYAAAGAGCIYAGRLGFLAQPRSRGAQVFTYRELERATDGFSEGNVVGRGAYGVVFRGRLADGTPAAIKRLRLDHRRQGEREFRIEVDLLSRMDSPYLVGLLGYCADQSHRLLVFEFMPNGSLKSHLHPPPPSPAGGKQHPPLAWQTRLGIALDCARALEFLHEHSRLAVIHRDFKCSNILLDHNYRARVSDFGMAKVGSNKADGQVVTRVLGTTGYLAPEYASTGKLTTKSDVYSYGVVLLELLTGRVPVDTQRPPGQHVLVSWALPRLTNRQKLVQMVDPALKGQFALKDLIQVAAIATMCIQTKAEYRPLMTDVVQSLIPIAKTTPVISCSSTPLRPVQHVVYMSPQCAKTS
ncbi:probable serine/threonine-protein kinase PBL7 [Phragmites australis]|uniref:probable serine/threonine-protein kinase PBL7 n=1 Tax=Phragmites australis TaxID=29695 RepID=UPI002D772F1D|nr:probable serine/threonine-protein kinase PBL7 [Phragmites australis]